MKLKASKFKFKTKREVITYLSQTKRGKNIDLSKCKTKHSNYEWIFCIPSK